MGKKEIIELIESGEIAVEDIVDAIMKVGSVEKKILAAKILGVDPNRIILEMFMGYKQRKQRKQLYSEDNTIPTTLISLYYELADRDSFESLKTSFVSRYIKNECIVEGSHTPAEIEGLREMYEFIHSDDIEYRFDVFTLKDIHEKLYSKTEYPFFGGSFRRNNAYVKGFSPDLVPYQEIFYSLKKLDSEVQLLRELAPLVKECGDSSLLLEYLDRCVVLGCDLLLVHPFPDGNGRSIRGFINKLLEDAGLPPVYITVAEKAEYKEAVAKAQCEGDTTVIKNFYRYKVCDSIIELDINRRVREDIAGNGDSGKFMSETVTKEKVDDLKRPKNVE